MGIQINGQTDIVTSTTSGGKVTIPTATFPSVTDLNATGIVTASSFRGNITGNVNSTGLSTFSSGVIIAAGTTSAPSISPTGDSNTGIFFPSPDTVAIAEGGVEALRIDSSANLLIGGTSSIGKVVVSTGFTSSNITTLGNFPTNSRILIDPGNPQLSNSQVFFGTGFASLGSGLNSGLGFIRENSGHWGTALTFYTHSTSTSVIDELLERVRIDSSGNLGIGTNSSFAKTHIEINASAGAGSGGAAALWLRNSNQTANNSATIFAGNNSSQASAAINFIHQNYSTNAGAITFDTRTDSSTYAERMRIDSSGRIITPNQPVFQAYGVSGGTFTNGNYWIFPTTLVNIGNHYNTSNGVFTAPVAGTYKFWWSFIGSNVNDVYRYSISKNNVSLTFQLRIDTTATGTEYGSNGSYSISLTLAVNDTVRIYFSSDGGNPSYPASNSSLETFTTFGGQFLG